VGPAAAPVTLVVFTDFWCSACRAVHGALVDYQKANPAGVRLVYRHLPLWDLPGHEFSGTAAALGEMAAEVGAFWRFAELLYTRTGPMGPDDYLGLMGGFGFDREVIEGRFADPEDPAILRVQRDMALAERLGVNGTPTFFVLLEDEPAISASQRMLPEILNAPRVLELLAQAAREHARQSE
jgi:protein-disulfide isomerase